MGMDDSQTRMGTSESLPAGKIEQLTSLLGKEATDKHVKNKLEYLTKEIKYPKGVFFIISNEFCERFSFYGLRTILSLYLHQTLNYDNNTSTMIYHVFLMLAYFFPIFGAILADSFIGKFRTIFYLSILYAFGNIAISFSSTPYFNLPMHFFSLFGLLLIAIGTGGIKPCVSAFGGDQFVLPEQERQLQQYFSIFYFAINAGSLISTYLTPYLRHNVHCLGSDSCYPLAFGVPAILMVTSLVIFVSGKKYYTMKEPEGNILVKVVKCISHAITNKICSKGEKKSHWLNYAEDKYDGVLIEETKSVLQVLLLFLPLPVFWALFDQQGSRWTFQATNMDGSLGVLGTVQPDQMQIVNPFLILLMIPLFETVIYPAFGKLHLMTRPLQKMSTGGILAAVAFIISGLLELRLEPTYAVLPRSGEGQIRIFNGLNCAVALDSPANSLLHANIDSLAALQVQYFPADNASGYLTSLKGNCLSRDVSWNGTITVQENEALSYFIMNAVDTYKIQLVPGYDNVDKSVKQYPKLRILYSVASTTNLTLTNDKITETVNLEKDGFSTPTKEMTDMAGIFQVNIGGKRYTDIVLIAGGVYTLIVVETNEGYTHNLITVTPPNSVHILWQLPQYVIITAAEVMFSVTGIEFSFTQAPKNMKSVLTAAWLMTTSLGNLIVIIIAKLKFDSQANEFFLFAGLMFSVMGIFIWMAIRYTYVNVSSSTQELKPTERGAENRVYVADV